MGLKNTALRNTSATASDCFRKKENQKFHFRQRLLPQHRPIHRLTEASRVLLPEHPAAECHIRSLEGYRAKAQSDQSLHAQTLLCMFRPGSSRTAENDADLPHLSAVPIRCRWFARGSLGGADGGPGLASSVGGLGP